MDIFKIIIIALVGVICAHGLKAVKSEFAIYVTIGCSIIIVSIIAVQFSQILDIFREIILVSNTKDEYIKILFKILIIAYLSDICSQFCKDMGEGAIGMKVELAGKISVFFLSMPIFSAIFHLINVVLQ